MERRPREAKLILHYADDPRPLAERYETILRVLNDPDYYAAQFGAHLDRWKGRTDQLEKFLGAMCEPVQVFDAAGLDSEWNLIGAARALTRNMRPLYFRGSALQVEAAVGIYPDGVESG